MALRLAHILTDCGVRSMSLSPDLGLHGPSGAMASGRVLAAVSRGGLSEEVNLLTSIARMTLVLHGAEDFQFVRPGTLRHPAMVHSSTGSLASFGCVIANPPFSRLRNVQGLAAPGSPGAEGSADGGRNRKT
ncbi:MAG: hypothetical protein MUO35_13960 [Anaerolineales bacterium]|nr:hypothetical protein [Anaerolineales bacterium]